MNTIEIIKAPRESLNGKEFNDICEALIGHKLLARKIDNPIGGKNKEVWSVAMETIIKTLRGIIPQVEKFLSFQYFFLDIDDAVEVNKIIRL